MLPVRKYIRHFSEIWENSPGNFPAFSKEYSSQEKLSREANYELFQEKIKAMQNRKEIKAAKSDPGASFFPMFKAFLETVFDFEKDHLKVILSEEFKNVSKDFFYRAREFGPELKPTDIYQGMRNVWIMNGLQLMMNIPVKITPSVFAYSMIYPYSDNLLDDPAITNTEKEEFSERFNRRLHGEDVHPASFSESQLFKLVEMFEEEFPRTDFPMVYESLYAIQQGQTNSLKMCTQSGLSDEQILEICFEKGGASVLADGYLVAGRLTPEQEQALFGYGVYLQLLDDIQDVKEDAQASTKTIFSCLPENDLGTFVNKTIHFGRTALAEMKCFQGSENDEFISLMNRSIETMLIESVGLNDGWFTQEYLDELERFSPLHFSFVREKRAQSKSQRFALFQKYFESAKPAAV
ncbi:class 1 isoprenoid biosynthesis enzyme [Maribellus sp. YY47]|uniref:class 1 isoprenoid biosynthesis enzyme n=1 Tax=Maribellus sp. YY47 TaxID=2929486 RepID=UPI002000B121|nr:class 1 isoprenoid biosynthesis enzyme [Maribellus sp. YY47]MCK3685023.1 class 1 isoprenoid biosynthesis enzyme [Maribellus sp. YY47]